jgi:hypothetical protein
VSEVVGVVPAAAGAADQPSVELSTVRGRPVIDHLVDRLHLAQPARILVVTSSQKQDLVDHLTALSQLGTGVQVVLSAPGEAAASLLLALEGLADDDIVLSGSPTVRWEPANAFPRLVGALQHDPARRVVLGLFQLNELLAADEVVVEADEMGLTVVSVRPRPADPVSDITWGCVAVRVSALRGLTDVAELGLLWDRLARDEPGSVVGLHLGREYFDVATEGHEQPEG